MNITVYFLKQLLRENGKLSSLERFYVLFRQHNSYLGVDKMREW